jgi:predicted nucleotidyltransferase
VDPKAIFEELLDDLRARTAAHYGERLVSLVVFGSVGRCTAGPGSDIDFLVVADPLPNGRTRRVRDFEPVEDALAPSLRRARAAGVHTRLSPLFKTPDEVRAGSPLFLDMTEDARILFDRGSFFAARLEALRERLRVLGSRRVWKGGSWYWVLKPDLQPGEVFEL